MVSSDYLTHRQSHRTAPRHGDLAADLDAPILHHGGVRAVVQGGYGD
ncbi:hypothetical protein [Streptomyces sp. GESEQ-4]|nr:hypothetical protein [Streptomyces sp. GESEQ-4]